MHTDVWMLAPKDLTAGVAVATACSDHDKPYALLKSQNFAANRMYGVYPLVYMFILNTYKYIMKYNEYIDTV